MVKKSAQQLINEAKGISAEEFISGKVSLGILPKSKKVRPVRRVLKTFSRGVASGFKAVGKPIKPLKVIGKKPKTKRSKKVQIIIKQLKIPKETKLPTPPKLTPQQVKNQRIINFERNKRLRDLQTLDFIRRL